MGARPQPYGGGVAIDWTRYRAVLFDLDGVLTPTASVHRRAWKRTLDAYLAARHPGESGFTDADYLEHVDGKPRYDGVRDFLRSRGIELVEGTPDEDPGWQSVCGIGNAKNEFFNRVLAEEGVEPYPGSLRLLDHLGRIGVPAGVVSSSANAGAVLAAAGLGQRFAVVVDGMAARRWGLAGKPAPDTFLAAVRLLGAEASASVVVEDAISGVAAGRAGGFALVVGVDRDAGVDELLAAGADTVVADLGDTVPSGVEPN